MPGSCSYCGQNLGFHHETDPTGGGAPENWEEDEVSMAHKKHEQEK